MIRLISEDSRRGREPLEATHWKLISQYKSALWLGTITWSLVKSTKEKQNILRENWCNWAVMDMGLSPWTQDSHCW